MLRLNMPCEKWAQMHNPGRIKSTFTDGFLQQLVFLRSPPEIFDVPHRQQRSEISRPDKLTQRIEFLLEKVPQNAKVLDLGAGYGEIAFSLEAYRNAQVLCVEREPEFLSSLRQKGLWVLDADLNYISSPALRWVFSQPWDIVIAVDTISYWMYPALILSALSDRVGKIILTVSNSAHFNRRIKGLLGKMQDWPNCRPSKDNYLQFDLSWRTNNWTLKGFRQWTAALGYDCQLIARRAKKARWLSPTFSPSLLTRSFVFELTPIT